MNRFFLLTPVFLLLLTGCNAQNTPQSVRDLAAAYLGASATDRALRAAQSENTGQLERAARDFQLVGPEKSRAIARQFVPSIADRAGQTWSRAQAATGAAKISLLRQTDGQFEAAFNFLPKDYNAILQLGLDKQTLNQLGYFLAERGNTREDFLLAEFLTSASLQGYDQEIGNPELSETFASQLRLERAVFAGDSLAWALFKQGRYREARRAQERVMATVEAETRAGARGVSLSAELPFHLAEIYRALGETELARKHYRAALALSPDAELRQKIEARIGG